jgi:hypothetical protein
VRIRCLVPLAVVVHLDVPHGRASVRALLGVGAAAEVVRVLDGCDRDGLFHVNPVPIGNRT